MRYAAKPANGRSILHEQPVEPLGLGAAAVRRCQSRALALAGSGDLISWEQPGAASPTRYPGSCDAQRRLECGQAAQRVAPAHPKLRLQPARGEVLLLSEGVEQCRADAFR